MADLVAVPVPDIGDFEEVPVIEILVAVGDPVAVEDPLVTLESDKASMDVPAPVAGVITELKVAVGDKVSEGTVILTLDPAVAGPAPDDAPPAADPAAGPASPGASAAAEPTPPPPDPAADRHTQVLVLGAGPGGYTAAFRAADLGLSVTLVERYATLGGVCLNVGCIPSKALLHVARVLAEADELSAHGIRFGEPELDVEEVRAWKDSVVGKLTGGIAGMAKQRKVEVVTGTARFVSPHTVEVRTGDGATTISFEHCIVAVGSSVARIPGLPYDDPRLMDSTGALEIVDVPQRLLVVGGGIIGLEMATVYDALGSSVTVVELLDGLMPGCDPDLVRPLQRRIGARYAGIHLATRVTAIEPGDDGLRVTFEGENAPDPAVFDRILLAVGRRPNGGALEAQNAGVTVDERGFIPVDAQQRTNVAHIYAIGDVVGEPMLAHKAMHEAKVAAEVIAGHDVTFDPRAIPSVAYTDPEVAWAGLTETDAKASGIAYEVGAFPWAASGRALAVGRGEGRTKVLVDPESRRLLGAGIVGPNAGELIAEAVHAIEMGADAADLGLTIHPHPTLSETLGLAAEVAEGTVTDLPPPRRRATT